MTREALWIIDGFNLIRRDPQLSRLEREAGTDSARAFLESQLGLFRAREGRGTAVLLVYDGVGVEPGGGGSRKGLRIAYSGKNDADGVILAEARRAEGIVDVCVVTSDTQDIAGRVRGLRVRCWSVEQFRGRLWGSASLPADAEKPKPPRGEEVDFWLREFGGE
ncbi:MAG: NYN domain-containing protein [Planctomycetota bacterium]